MEGNYLSRDKHKEESFSFEEHTWGTSWPARNYACSFCKREFRSAQALGGHMNVHRRDRARLRSGIPSWVSECPKPNPNPNPTTTTITTTKPNPTLLLPSSILSPLSSEFLNYTHRSSLHSPSLTLSSSPSLASASEEKKPTLTSFQLPLLSPQSGEIKMNYRNTRSAFGSIGELKGCSKEEEHKISENNNEDNITLELGIGLLQHPKEKLDLELRLGHC